MEGAPGTQVMQGPYNVDAVLRTVSAAGAPVLANSRGNVVCTVLCTEPWRLRWSTMLVHRISLDNSSEITVYNLPCVLQGLLGGFSNLVEVMRGEGSPPTAVRAVVFGALCQLDAELLNQLLVRRDCCTMSAIKILQVGVQAADLSPWPRISNLGFAAMPRPGTLGSPSVTLPEGAVDAAELTGC